MERSHPALKAILRLFGTSSLFGMIFVAVPYDWMNEIHRALGLGTLPPEPIVGYLARSLSAFYALTGGLFWMISFDVVRYRPVVIYLGVGIILIGVALLVIDLAEGLPKIWAFWEGPVVTLLGLSLTILGVRSRSESQAADEPPRPTA